MVPSDFGSILNGTTRITTSEPFLLAMTIRLFRYVTVLLVTWLCSKFAQPREIISLWYHPSLVPIGIVPRTLHFWTVFASDDHRTVPLRNFVASKDVALKIGTQMPGRLLVEIPKFGSDRFGILEVVGLNLFLSVF